MLFITNLANQTGFVREGGVINIAFIVDVGDVLLSFSLVGRTEILNM